jgi:hypothetical protein
LQVLERDLFHTTKATERLTPGGAAAGIGGGTATVSAEALAASPLGVVGTLLAAAVVGVFNAMMLNIFFRDVLGTQRLLAYPLPNIQVSQVLGLLFFFLEVGVGHFLGQSKEESDDSRTSAFMLGFMPWFVLFALAAVEVAAYGTLSQQIDLAARLHLDPASPLYNLVTYFLAFLGAGITLIIAGLGYVAARQWSRYKTTRVERAIYKAMQDAADTAATHEDRLHQVGEALDRLRVAVTELPRDVSKRASEALGTPSDATSLLALIKEHLALLMPRSEDPVAPFLRSALQVVSELALQLFFAFVTVLAFVAMFATYLRLLTRDGAFSIGEAKAMAGVLSLGVVGLGFFLRDSKSGGHRGTLVRVVATTIRARSLWALAAFIGLLTVGALNAVAATYVGLFGSNVWLNSLFGFVATLILAMLGGVLDQALAGIGDAATLTWLGLGWVVGRLVLWMGVTIAFLLDVIRFVSDAIATPGGWLRGARTHV